MKANLTHVAKLAGVSMATVDRVLNERGGVSPATAERVIRAAEAAGIRRLMPELYRRTIAVEIIIQKGPGAFSETVHNALQRFVEQTESTMTIRRAVFDGRRRNAIQNHLNSVTCDAVIILCRETPSIVEAVNSAAARGMPIVTISTDLSTSSRIKHFGIDNFAAGRTAAYFLTRMVPGSKGRFLVAGDFSDRSEAERRAGFEQGLRKYSHEKSICLDLSCPPVAKLGHVLNNFLQDSAPPDAIYMTNADVRQALDVIRTHDVSVPIIAHDLTPTTREHLKRGDIVLLIDQNIQIQLEQAAAEIERHFGLANRSSNLFPTIPYTILTPENFSDHGEI